LDKLAEEEKDARSKAEAEDIAAQARRALEEKKRREAERVAAEKEAKAAEKEARRREARERREADAVARMAIRNEENERKIADAARRRAENEIRELENAAAALEADAEREARRARDAEMREAARALKEAETESKRMAAELESSAPKQPATSSTTTVVQPPSERVTELPSRLARAALTKTDDLPSDDDDLPQGGSGLDPARTVAIVPGHWIDPGFDGEEGPPGERALNLVIANRAHALLGDDGWTVLRPDLAVPPLAREQYVAWVKTQSSAGVAVLEVHGRSGTDEDELSSGVKHTRTGVISQDDSVLGAELAKSFGTFGTMSWRELAVPRCGGAVLESFDSSTLEAMDAVERSETVDGIARDIAAAVSATAVVTPPEGCSVSGCSRWREDD
jgi:chemotaxis protein histidine kinase CheA